MASGSEKTIAQELSDKQREISVAEFFKQNKQMLGFGSKARSMVTAVKEGVDNAIDAAEDADILPTVRVTIEETDNDYYKITIQDNGPGITKENIPKVFGKLLYGSRFAKRVQRRGQQGIGISAAVMYSQLTTGKPAEVISKTKENDQGEYFEVGIDTDTNEPNIRKSEQAQWEHDSPSGTSITIYIEANFRSRKRLHEYIRHTAIVNPHATVELNEPEKTAVYKRSTDELPQKPTEIDPHPHGIEFGTLRSLIEVTPSHSIKGFLQEEFTRVGPTTAQDILQEFLNTHYGKECQWSLSDLNTEYEKEYYTDECIITTQDRITDTDSYTPSEYVTKSINRKTETLEDNITNNIFTQLKENDAISYSDVCETVEDVSDELESEGHTIGDTVRNKVIDSVWDTVQITQYTTINNIIDENTTSKKSQSDIEELSKSTVETLNQKSEHNIFTYTELHSLIETAVNSAETTASVGSTAIANITDGIWDSMRNSQQEPPLLKEIDSDRDMAESLHNAMQNVSVMAPPSHCLSPIGEEDITKGLQKAYDADFYTGTTRNADTYSGEPFVIEAGIAYGGDIEEQNDITLLRFANRVPLVYQQGACVTTKVASDINWNNYNLSDKGSGLPQGPVSLMIHVASTNVPFTSESKDAVASAEILEDEIERAIRDVARDLKSHLKKEESRRKQRRKKNIIAEILPDFSRKISTITGNKEQPYQHSLSKIMNGIHINTTSNDDSTKITVYNYGQTKKNINIQVTVKETRVENYSDIEKDKTITYQETVPTNTSVSIDCPIKQSDIESISPVFNDTEENTSVSVA